MPVVSMDSGTQITERSRSKPVLGGKIVQQPPCHHHHVHETSVQYDRVPAVIRFIRRAVKPSAICTQLSQCQWKPISNQTAAIMKGGIDIRPSKSKPGK